MIEVNFTIDAEKVNHLIASLKDRYPQKEAFNECVSVIKAHAPKEPLIGALKLTVHTIVTAQRTDKNLSFATTYLYMDEQIKFLKECMLEAGCYWNRQQIAIQHSENKYGESREIRVSLQALEMCESDFTEKKKLKEKETAPYERLANAITMVAVDDFRTAKMCGNVEAAKAISKFFRSKYFSNITNLNGDALLKKLCKESVTNEKAYKPT